MKTLTDDQLSVIDGMNLTVREKLQLAGYHGYKKGWREAISEDEMHLKSIKRIFELREKQ